MRHPIARVAVAMLLAASACKDSPAPTTAGPSTAPRSAPATPGDQAPALETADRAGDICRTLDRGALAAAAGVEELTKIAFSGVVADGSSSRDCAFMASGGGDLGVVFETDDALERRDTLGRFTWAPHDGLGAPAAIGRSARQGKETAHVQVATRGIRIKVELTSKAPDLQARALAVMSKVVAALPDDPERLIPHR